MCDTEMREGYTDPLSLLKNCDATTLGKLCEAVTSMADESMAYANFPKRSLVKCFSARNKYEWHLTQTAELEDLERRWRTYKEQLLKTKSERRRQPIPHIIHEEHKEELDSAECLQLRRQASQKTIGVPRQCPSPLTVNEDILREALMVAQHFELSEESELPSPLSSDQKTPSDGSENEADKFPRYRHPAQTNGLPAQRSRPVQTSITTPKQRHSSHIFPSSQTKQALLHNSRRPQPDDRKVERQVSPLTPQVRGQNAVTTPRRGKGSRNGTPVATPRRSKKAVESPRQRSGRSSGDRLLRGAFGGCLGSKHASVDFTSPRKRRDHSAHRHASTGPSTRSLFGGGRLKKTSSCRLDHDTGSFGSLRFRSSGGMKASGPRVWR